MIGLETERLVFRQWKNSDFGEFLAFYSDEINSRFVGGIKKPEDAWRLMAGYAGHYTLKGFSYLATVEKATNRLVGTVGLWDSEPWPENELGYWLLSRAQGTGFGVEAGIAVRDFARHKLNLPSLVSYIDPANEPSKRLALKLGAKPDGIIGLQDYGPHEVYRYW